MHELSIALSLMSPTIYNSADLAVIETSARTGQGLDPWIARLESLRMPVAGAAR